MMEHIKINILIISLFASLSVVACDWVPQIKPKEPKEKEQEDHSVDLHLQKEFLLKKLGGIN